MKHNVRTTARWILASLSVPLIALGVAGLSTGSIAEAANGFSYQVNNSARDAIRGSEIVDVTPNKRFGISVGRTENQQGGLRDYRLWVVTLTPGGLVADNFNIKSQFASALTDMTEPVASSVVIHPSGTYAIVTLREDSDAGTAAGRAIFLNIDQNTGAITVRSNTPLILGINPESIAIDPTGTYAVVANEGNLGASNSPGPNGSVSLIDLDTTPGPTVVPVAIGGTNPNPEEVDISSKGQAFVSLQSTSEVAVLDINNTTTPVSVSANVNRSVPGSYPDGLAVTPDGNYLVTANEGVQNIQPASISLWSITGNNLAKVGTDISFGLTSTPDDQPFLKITPEMVDIGTISGVVKAFVTLENEDAVAAINVASSGLVLDEVINLNPNNTFPVRMRPEGIVVVENYVVVVSTQTKNATLIVVTGPNGPTPTPSASASASPSASPSTPGAVRRTFLPVVQK